MGMGLQYTVGIAIGMITTHFFCSVVLHENHVTHKQVVLTHFGYPNFIPFHIVGEFH